MKITKVTPLMLDGICWSRLTLMLAYRGSANRALGGSWKRREAAIEKFGRYLVGEDPLRIEHHWQYMYRFSHFRGAAIMGALSAIDIALWDIMGKHFDAPVHQLLGGKVRDRARVYYHVFGDTTDRLVKGIADAEEMGFTAVDTSPVPRRGTRRALLQDSRREDSRRHRNGAPRYRETVGDAVDLCIEIHRRLTPTEAVQLGLGIEEFHPYFYEDPVTPDNFDEMAYVADKINIPIATGERYSSLWEFQMALARCAVQYVRPDVCLVGGITGARKIAALAEAHHVGVVPHNPLSPVSTAACLQIAATAPNFALQEYPTGEDAPPKSDMVAGTPQHDGNGYLIISDEPGIGLELKADAVEKCPPTPREVETRLHFDGSVIDQ